MSAGTQAALTYLKLSELYNRKGQSQQRDRFLVLAADSAQAAGKPEDAEKLRLRLLKHNPHHLLRPYASFEQAMSSADVQSYVKDLRNSYPPRKAAEMLAAASQGTTPPAAQPKPLPPTQPVVDLDAEAGDRHAEEPLKVYRVREEHASVPKTSTHGFGERAARTSNPAAATKTQTPPATSRRPTTAARPNAPARPTVAPAVYLLAPERSPQASGLKLQQDHDAAADGACGGWVGTSLFVLVLATGLALSIYALAGPVLFERR
jgi:hypothetical protein